VKFYLHHGIIETYKGVEIRVNLPTASHPKFGIKKLKKMSYLKRSVLCGQCIDLIRSKGYIDLRTSNLDLAALDTDQIRDIRDMIDWLRDPVNWVAS